MADRYHGPKPMKWWLSKRPMGTQLSLGHRNRNSKGSPQLHQPAAHAPAEFTMQELDYVITRLQKNKAPGPDETRAEIILLLNYWGQQELLRIINQCFRERKVPQSSKEALNVSIYKGKRSDSDPANYRPISLLNTFYKIYAAITLQIRPAAEHDHHLGDTQYGFRAAKSTQDPLLIHRRAQDLSIKTGLPCLLFLDWRMAFDKWTIDQSLSLCKDSEYTANT